MKKIIITGITGQDGSLMTDYLLANTDAQIYGVIRQLSVPNHINIVHLKDNKRVHLIEGDITCAHSMSGIVKTIMPDYFINFAANSFVATSWKNPTQVVETNAISVMHQLEAIRKERPSCRYYQAGSSEEFGDVLYSPQDENHPLRPRSPYGAAKAAARHFVKVYRETYNLYAVAGWLFNHEGIRRGEQFVTRKITKGVARIARTIKIFHKGVEGIAPLKLVFEPIHLGNMQAKRDWSDAEDFMDGVWRMLNQDEYNPYFDTPRDYVLASGEAHTIGEFVEEAFKAVNIDVLLLNRAPICSSALEDHSLDMYCMRYESEFIPVVVVDKDFYRPCEVSFLLGNPLKAKRDLGWAPKTSFPELVKKMVRHDLENI